MNDLFPELMTPSFELSFDLAFTPLETQSWPSCLGPDSGGLEYRFPMIYHTYSNVDRK